MSELISDWDGYTNEQKHKALWNWLAENPEMEKTDFFNIYEIEKVPLSECYACMECLEDCCKCPIDWTKLDEEGSPCFYSDSLYYDWHASRGEFEKRAELATKISNIPWKAGGWN